RCGGTRFGDAYHRHQPDTALFRRSGRATGGSRLPELDHSGGRTGGAVLPAARLADRRDPRAHASAEGISSAHKSDARGAGQKSAAWCLIAVILLVTTFAARPAESALGHITPKDMLSGRQQQIHAERIGSWRRAGNNGGFVASKQLDA